MIRDFVTSDLFDRHTDGFVECRLYRDIAPNNVQDFAEKWRPIFDAKKEQLKAEGSFAAEALKEYGLQDAHWKWPEKVEFVSKNGGWIGLAVECEDVTQGLMFVAPFGFARESSQKGLPITQVELLSTAPWNRRNLVPAPRFKGVGEMLLSAAITISLEEEHEGRIGLHALSGAEEWYRDYCGMSDLGFDAEKKMHYFEMTASQAIKYIS